jgi:hypothetical protein
MILLSGNSDSLFTDAEKTDLDYFGIIAKKVLDEKHHCR